jgi:phosphatidylserine/phosphatidylglycerophosphate/cardiolipin synthase-like enzyme
MPGFVQVFDASLVSTMTELVVVLADPGRVDPLPIVRPGVAQHAGDAVVALDLSGAAAIPISAPVDGIVRRVKIDGALPGGATELLEIVPLPFATPAIPGGMPTFYVAPFDQAPPDGERVAAGAVLASAPTRIWVAARQQNAFRLSAFEWIQAIGAVLPAAEQAAWLAQETVYGGGERLRVTDHVGAPVPGTTFAIDLRDGGNVLEAWERTLDARSDLALTIADQPLENGGSPFASLYAPPAGQRFTLRYVAAATPTGPRPIATGVQSFYPAGPSAAPDASLEVAPGEPRRRTLQVLALEDWFAPSPEGAAVPMFRTGSRIEPLVDGTETFRRLALDLDETRRGTDGGAPLGAHFTGLLIFDFPLIAGRDDTRLTVYANDALAHGGSMLVLADKFLNLADPDVFDVRRAAAVLLFLMADATLFASALGSLETDARGGIFLFFAVVGLTLVLTQVAVPDDAIEKSQPALDALNTDRDRPIAIYSRPPMTIDDNPLTPPSKLYSLEDTINQFGFWHGKAQLVRRAGTAGPESYVAFLGGIDINPNRLDTPSHQIASPYHDVHARVSGPIVADVFASFRERWEHDAPLTEPRPADIVIEPAMSDLQSGPSKHIARIGRTYYGARPSGPAPLADFAPHGERTIYETLIRAIAAARDHIYIEDQYFNPNDEFVEGLVAASAQCRRLVVLLPTESDQIFGDRRRRRTISLLRGEPGNEKWGSRFFIGCPMRRPILSSAGRVTGTGRCVLVQPAAAGDTSIFVAPPSRVPKLPGWLWVDGELMLARTDDNTTVDGKPARRVSVIREGAGSLVLGTRARAHQVGAAVTFSQPKGIYVHAKCMMIDDLFVSIGSANLNRRGFFHDGELNVFAIPEELRAASDNPARAVRTALMAQQLGLPPVMASLLGDATSAFDLFVRSRFITRAAPYSAIDIRPDIGVDDFDLLPGSVLQTLKAQAGLIGIATLEQMLTDIWNVVIDPTSFVDPNPQPGP